MDLFTEQFFIGFSVGVICLGIYFITFKPLAGNWAKKKIRLLENARNQSHIKLLSIMKGDEIIFHRWKKADGELELIKERLRSANKINVDLGDTIAALSKEKSALQDERAKLFIENDTLKAKLIRINSPAYEKSGKVITKEGKVKNVSNRRTSF